MSGRAFASGAGGGLRAGPAWATGAALLATLALACGPSEEPAQPAAPPLAPAAPTAPRTALPAASPGVAPSEAGVPAAQREAEVVFSTRCATCHGPLGAGDGPGSTGLDPKPRDFRSAAWQASVTDTHLQEIIVGGGLAVGKSALMPPNPDLAAKPEVVAALVGRVRSLRSP